MEEETEVLLRCPFLSSLERALDRFRGDEERFGVGLKAILTTESAGMLFIGSNSRKSAACLSYASQEDVDAAKPRLPRSRSVAGGNEAVGFAEFHLFYPDCPSYMSEYETLPWPRVRELVLAFAAMGAWPSQTHWFDRE
jgi:hypothetical protein